jgi:cyclase
LFATILIDESTSGGRGYFLAALCCARRNGKRTTDRLGVTIVDSTLIVAKIKPAWCASVAEIFRKFDDTDMPHRMGTRRRQLFSYKGLYFHLQDFDSDSGGELIEAAKTDPRFIQISDDLRPFIEAYDPATWRSPADAMAGRFYSWDGSA